VSTVLIGKKDARSDWNLILIEQSKFMHFYQNSFRFFENRKINQFNRRLISLFQKISPTNSPYHIFISSICKALTAIALLPLHAFNFLQTF